ncbi:MAG: hypothetical protein E6J41_23055 [Chloroflexi bacterium]|nr:MAG: hypothetical protein E6J41_23055 [Chloroflexota bacterium]
MTAAALVRALDAWGVQPRRQARAATTSGELGNQAWHVWTRDGRHLVARRHTALRSRGEVGAGPGQTVEAPPIVAVAGALLAIAAPISLGETRRMLVRHP